MVKSQLCGIRFYRAELERRLGSVLVKRTHGVIVVLALAELVCRMQHDTSYAEVELYDHSTAISGCPPSSWSSTSHPRSGRYSETLTVPFSSDSEGTIKPPLPESPVYAVPSETTRSALVDFRNFGPSAERDQIHAWSTTRKGLWDLTDERGRSPQSLVQELRYQAPRPVIPLGVRGLRELRKSVDDRNAYAGKEDILSNRSRFREVLREDSEDPDRHGQSDHGFLASSHILKHTSALYGILITITSTCLTLTAYLTHNVDSNYSRWFDCGMLITGILFLVFSILILLRQKSNPPESNPLRTPSGAKLDYKPANEIFHHRLDSGSFYMKMGALVFAVGSLIYTSLEIGVFAENRSCFNIVMALQPCLFVTYVMLQLYFIFLSYRLRVGKYRPLYWFGMIHLAATDFSLWIRILMDETHHEFRQIEEKRRNISETNHLTEMENTRDPSYRAPLCVNEESLMKDVLDKASTFLYPCTIEYSLITAGILVTMWQVFGTLEEQHNNAETVEHRVPAAMRYSVDCDQSSRGLFMGIVALVLTIVGIIIYFVFLEHKPPFGEVAIIAFQTLEIILNGLGLLIAVGCLVTFIRHLKVEPAKGTETKLEDALLMICMLGVYSYGIVSLMGSYMVDTQKDWLSLVGTSLILLEATVQTVFIIGTGKRVVSGGPCGQLSAKPGREMLTFLILLNFALWAVDVFCLMRSDSSPIQRDYFGEEQWAVLLHVTVPLVIFYRFHSTVCLVDIWKRAYKAHKRQPALGR